LNWLSLPQPTNSGPPHIDAPIKNPTAAEIMQAHEAPPNGMQKSLAHLATTLPAGSSPIQAPSPAPPANVADALKTVKTGLSRF